MAAILKLKRGTSFSSPQISEPFFDTTKGTILVGSGSGQYITLARISSGSVGKINTGDFWVSGDVTASNLNLSGDITARNTTLTGDIIIGGNIFLGNEVANNIIVQASLSGSLIPSASAEYNLGSEIRKWNELWVVSASLDSVSVPGSGILSSSNENFVDYSESVDLRLDNAEWTGSNQEGRIDNLENTGSNHADRIVALEWTGSDHETRLDEIETTFSSSVDLRLDNLEWTGSDHESRLDTLEGSFSESVDLRLDNLEWTGSDHESRLDEIETTFSESVDLRLDNLEWTGSDHESRLDTLEGSFSESVDLRLDNLEWTGSDHESRLDEIETTFSSSVDLRLDLLEYFSSSEYITDSSSFDLRLDNLEGTFSESVDGRLDSIEEYTHSLKEAISVNGSDLTVIGNLIVQGTQTSLNTTEVVVEDILLALASGSATSAESDGGGIFISGANASITWNHPNQLMEFNTKVSSSVGFKGDGSELINIQHGNIDFGGSNIVSGSDQVSGSIYGDISGDITINNLAVASISTGVIVNADVNSNAAIHYTKLNLGESGIVSGSSQINADETNGWVGDVKTQLNNNTVVSGSSQVSADQTDGWVGDVKTQLNNNQVVSGSDQLSGSYDDRYLQILGDSVVSSSNQVSESIYTSMTGVVQVSPEGSVQIVDGSIFNVDINDNAGIHHTKIGFDGSNIVSGSSQVTESLDLRYEPIASGTHTLISSSVISSPDQGLVKLTSNGIDGSNVSLGLEETDSPTFNGLTLTGLSSLGASDVNVIISGSGGELGYRAVGTAAFFNVSASVGDDPNSIPTNKAVSDALIAAGAGDITAVNDSTIYNSDYLGLEHTGDGTLNGGYGQIGNVVIALATGSVRFTEGVVQSLPNGTVSGSDQLTSSFDSRYLEILGDGVVSGSSQISADQTDGWATDVKTQLNLNTVISGSSQILFGTGIVSSSQQISNYNKFLEINGDGVVSGSSQITLSGDITGPANNTAIGTGVIVNDDVNASAAIAYTKLNLGGSGIISGSTQITNGSGIVSSSEQISDYDVFLEINGMGVISGSQQFTGSFVTLDTDQTISGEKTFNNIIVNGTGSFAYIESIGGTAKIIGDSFVVVNTATPTSRYAGLSVYDSGSTLSTSSFYFDGQTNDWGYEYSSSAGVDYAVTIFGPEYSTKGTPTYLTSNRIPKAVDNHHLNDSNISDNGTLITLGSNSQVNGTLGITGVTSITNTTQSTSITTGALKVSGGVGIAKTLNVGEDVVAYASSDRRLKDNILPIENSLQKINQIGGYSFEWNVEKQNIYSGKDYGVIAQEIEQILPELVDTRENGYKAVKYDRLVSLLIEGIKELSKQVAELKQKN